MRFFFKDEFSQKKNNKKTEKYFSRRQAFAGFPTWLPQV